jgi:membrane protein YqaA with SNARE-associated domain
MASATLLFLVIFALNALPAFAPPTWMILSYFGLHYPNANPWIAAGVAAVAASGGRAVLAQFARFIVGSGFVSHQMRDSLSEAAQAIARRRSTSALGFLLFAFSPLPSNVLFLAYGLMCAPLWLLVGPFFVGRFVSYAIAFLGASALAQHFELELSFSDSLLYFVATQLGMLVFVYGFAKVDWRRVRVEHRLRWLS